MDQTVVALDIGTTKICTLVAEVGPPPENKLRIVGVGTVPSKGIRRGVVVDVGEVTNAILESIHLAERTSGYEIASAYVGLAGAHIQAVNSRGVGAISQGERGVRPLDVDRALEATGELLKRNFLPQAQEIEKQAGKGIEDIRKGVEEAAEALRRRRCDYGDLRSRLLRIRAA